jgi:glycosyltransferase involved in cell wall biosynthesis
VPDKLKKIIVVGPVYPYRGGNSLFISYLYDSLKDHFNVKIFNYTLLYPSLLFPGTTQYDKSGTVVKKAPSERLVNSINPFNWYKVAQRINKEDADLVVFDWWHPFFGMSHYSITKLLDKKYRNRIIFITENFISHEANAVDKILTTIGLSNASAFISLSDIVVKDLKDTAEGRKIYRSDLPVFDCYKMNPESDPAALKQKLGFNPADTVLTFFGYVRKYKGLDILIDAFPAIKKEIPDAKLLIVGEFYDDPSFYTNKIKQYGIEGHTKLINWFVPNEKVGQYIEASDLLVLPYRSATQSGILNIAYAFEKPAVVTSVGGLEEFVKHKKTGMVVKPDSPEQIVNGVLEYFRIRESIDFRTNIRNLVKQNKHNKLPELFREIIKDVEAKD